jgi:SAM-dependent methyltransferase
MENRRMSRRVALVVALAVSGAWFAALVPVGSAGWAFAEDVKRDVPYIPTPQNVVDEMLKVAAVTKNDTVYDLGCGDGRIVITAAKQYGARGVGADIDPQRIKESNENAQKAGVTERVKFVQQDLFTMDLKEATVVTLYLLPAINLKLRPKLLRELKPGTRVVSHAFDMGDWKPERTVRVDGRTIYYWVIPPRAQAN